MSATRNIDNLSMNDLRKGLAGYSRLLGIDRKTCLGLTLMLDSREAILAMLKFMALIHQNGLKPGTMEDITTIVCNLAAELRDVSDGRSVGMTADY